jgi:hypothetical protein
MQPTTFENLEDARQEITLRATMWRSLREWQDMNEAWIGTAFKNIDSGEIAK